MSHTQAAVAAAVLVAVACVGAASDSSVGRGKGSAIGGPPRPHTEASLRQASEPRAVNIVSPNLRLPRPPRHRCERPTTGVEEVEVTTAARLIASLREQLHRALVETAVDASPLAGHPLALLRPPSLPAV